MKKILEVVFNNVWVKVMGTFLFVVIPAYPFYKDLVIGIFGGYKFNLELSKYIIDIITGFLLGGMFLLFLQSKKEYIRIKAENHRIREMLLTIHTFDNIRFSKIKPAVKNLFQNEEQILREQLKDVFKRDLGQDYMEDDINNILDCFYRGKQKF